ncbi:hypothetical protein [Agrococcus sp. KRD186]|jgi:uncharacterized protein YukE|uniref:hypothetical protein n=1 Tax=Agrococcus sp. KRD186 TaxID=2729730 RepID=UPI0019D22DD8|nr:hypothetical protein [Agrococcus sp. KRD186]
MAEQQATVSELNSLIQTMEQMISYCDALKQGAGGFAYMLPNEWQGPAMNAFLGQFETWAAGAQGMRMAAEALKGQAKTSHDAYDQTINQLNESWSTLQTNLS